MKHALALVFITFFASLAQAQERDAAVLDDLIVASEDADLSKFLWKNRLIVVFADSAADPRFAEQIELLGERPVDLAERDVRILLDTDPAALTDLRKRFRPRGFMLVLVAKDGQVYLRKPKPWDVREISRSIDKLPQRQQEIRDRR